MATAAEHHREAEQLLSKSTGQEPELAAQTIAAAQVHATLALAAALNGAGHDAAYKPPTF